MTRSAQQLLEEALHLSPDDRAALASQLWESTEGEPESDAQAAWGEEIARRIAEMRDGTVQGIPWEEARRQIMEDDDADD